MDGDHFQPSGFGLLPTVAVAAVATATGKQIVDNLSNMIADNREQGGWDRIDATMKSLMADNEMLRLRMADHIAAFDAITAQYNLIAELAIAQATQLKELRDAGIID
jgi:hypothetical protein